MYRVLLADDDPIVRTFLPTALDWGAYGFTIDAEAADGESALERTLQLRPDLLLLDMQISRMNSTELIRRLRAEGYDGAIAGISCRDALTSVKQALQSGADEYLLKSQFCTGKPDTVLQSLRELVQKRRRMATGQRHLELLAMEGRRSLQQKLLTLLLSNIIPSEDLPPLLREAGLDLYRRCVLILFRLEDTGTEPMNRLIEAHASHTGRSENWIALNFFGAVLLNLEDEPSARAWRERTDRLCTQLENAAQQYELPLSLGVSSVCAGDDASAQALRQAYAAFQEGFYHTGRHDYGSSHLSAELPQAAAIFAQTLPELLQSGAPHALESAYNTALDAMQAAKTHPDTVLEWLRSCDRIAGIRRRENDYIALLRFSQYHGCSAAYLHQQAEHMPLPDTAGPAVRTAAQYVLRHYPEPIGLGHAARAAGLTPTYLSALFKKEMGIGFAEYLLGTRLAHVKRGLRNSRETVKELSQQAGFPDYSYFCKIFKKKLGVSPRDYRAMQHDEKS